MTRRESDKKKKLTRRVFIQYSATVTSVVAGASAMTLKTDAMAQTYEPQRLRSDGSASYPYQ